MHCVNCGAGLEKSDNFCGACGVSAIVTDDKTEDSAQTKDEATTRNELATPALVLGILSVFFFEYVPVPLAALVVGVFALTRSAELQKLGAKKSGKGKAISGVALGALYLVVWFVYFTGIYR